MNVALRPAMATPIGAAPDAPTHAPTTYDRLALAAFVALVVHGTLILGVSFGKEDPVPSNVDTLDVVLVTHRTERAPEQAKRLAQANTDGGADLPQASEPATTPADTPLLREQVQMAEVAPDSGVSPPRAAAKIDRPAPSRMQNRPLAPAPVPAAPVQPTAAKPKPASEPAPAAARVVTAERQDAKREVQRATSTAESATAPDPAPAAPPADVSEVDTSQLSASSLVSRSLAMASLSASVDDKLRAYSERPREKYITTRTREHVFAAYLDAWRAKVERVGNLNYPDEARRSRLSGRLQLDVALRPDGSIESIDVRRPSRHQVLDDAAVRIVKLAAPYARFPDAIAAKVDVLHIVRTWVFSASNQFESGR